MTGKETQRKVHKGIYILPNMFTTLNIFCGFYAIISSVSGNFKIASFSILIAVIFDALDGKIARATHTTSRFGVEYDSLSDLISFGLAPALLIYYWALVPLGKLGWLAAFMFMACGALRLARFNANEGKVASDYFQGLPIPAGAAMNSVTYLFLSRLGLDGNISPWLLLIQLYILAFLMVSSLKYESFKKAELFTKMRFQSLVGFILVFVLIVYAKSIALFIIFLMYVLSGPVMTLFLLYKERSLGSASTD